jgi:putative transposase
MASKPREFNSRFAYHIYNCGVEKRKTFLDTRDFERFIDVLAFYKHKQKIPFKRFNSLTQQSKDEYLKNYPASDSTKRIEILAYCLMPNHFHLLIRPVGDFNPGAFIADVQNSYTKYFNKKNERLGALFQGEFKSKKLDSNGDVINLSRYIHLNPYASSKTNPNRNNEIFRHYRYGSYQNWIKLVGNNILDKKTLVEWVSIAGGQPKYEMFVSAGLKNRINLGIEVKVIEQNLE